MKKHASVFMLSARGTVVPFALLLLLMAAVEGGTFALVLSRGAAGEAFAMEDALRRSRAVWVFGACFLLTTALLCLNGVEMGGKEGYTLARLRVSERWVFFWQSLYNTVCYIILWAAQILIAIGLCRWFAAAAAPGTVGPQDLFLAFYRSGFLHSLLPFEDGVFWVRNGMLAICLGVCAAWFPMAQRRGRRSPELIAAASIAVALFQRDLGQWGGCVITTLVAALCLGVALSHAMEGEAQWKL